VNDIDMDPTSDGTARKRQPALKPLLVATIVGALSGGSGYLFGRSLPGHPALNEWVARVETITAWDLLAVPVLTLFVLGVHELGHLLAGLSQGMRFLLLIFGPFQWHASESGIRFAWVTRLGLMGGLAATIPTEIGPRLDRQLAVMIAGGPVASLLLAGAALALAIGADGRIAAYGAFVAVASFGIFLVTAIPMRGGGFMSDGMQLLDVARGRRSVRERTDLLRVFAQSLAGVRPRDWAPDAVDAVIALDSDEPLRRIAAWQLLLYRAMDSGSDADVQRHWHLLAEHVDDYPDGFRQSIHVELSICAAHVGDVRAARHHLERAKGGVVEKSRRYLAEAALAALEQRHEDAARSAQQAGRALSGAMDRGIAQLTADQLSALAVAPRV
jgi:hypothetical protein